MMTPRTDDYATCPHMPAMALCLVFVAACFATADTRAGEPKTNFVFFLADDLGWRDLGSFGSSFYESPRIDRLCAQGVKFTNAYSAGTVCSPTRASIITGRYPARTGCTNFGGSISGDEFTVGQALSESGYATFFVGKWHIGGTTPLAEGFAQGGSLNGTSDDPKGTRAITQAAVQFIEGAKGRPFFAYVNYHAVHLPLRERAEIVARHRKRKEDAPPQPGRPAGLEKERDRDNKQVQDDEHYAAMVEVLDDSVRRILEAVDQIGATDNTVVIFSSDNGGLSTKPCTSNLPLRAGKGWAYEGGVRVPTIIHWPGVTRPGTVCDVPITSTDFYPTILEMAGVPLRPKDHCDGVSLAGLLRSGTAPDREALYWHYPHHHGAGSPPCGAVRAGNYKLIQFYEDGKLELYDLDRDLSELNDLSAAMPRKQAELLDLLKTWQGSFPELKYSHARKKRPR